MHITRILLENIRSLSPLDWAVDAGDASGWHVILGDNGSGKSTFVRSIAVALIGPKLAYGLRQNWDGWLRPIASSGRIYTVIASHVPYDNPSDVSRELFPYYDWVTGFVRNKTLNTVDVYGVTNEHHPLWEQQKKVWFSASYGPFRRFTGGDADIERAFHSSPILSRHITAFGENVALSDCLAWMRELQFKSLEKDKEASQILDSTVFFINQPNFLPNNVRLSSVSSAGVLFTDTNGNSVLAEELSDGFRSILSLTLDLLKNLIAAYGPDIFETSLGEPIKVKVPGVVLIDEIDAHLHPIWQRRIGFWLREHFPNIQFIVTTHSPLVCQAAEKGSIFLLPRPGTNETGRMLTGVERERLLYGNILDAYSTEAFGSGITRSDQSREMLDRLGELNIKEITEGLSDTETAEQEKLRATLPTTASALPDGFAE